MDISRSGDECVFTIFRDAAGGIRFGSPTRGSGGHAELMFYRGNGPHPVDLGYFHTHILDPESVSHLKEAGVDPCEFYRLPTVPQDLDFLGDVPEQVVCVGVPGDSQVFCYVAKGSVREADIARWRSESKRFLDIWGDIPEDDVRAYLGWVRGVVDRHYDVISIGIR